RLKARCSRVWLTSCRTKARISSARAGGAPSRNAFTDSMNKVSPRGKVAESALNQAVATGSPAAHQRSCEAERPKRRFRTWIAGALLPRGGISTAIAENWELLTLMSTRSRLPSEESRRAAVEAARALLLESGP